MRQLLPGLAAAATDDTETAHIFRPVALKVALKKVGHHPDGVLSPRHLSASSEAVPRKPSASCNGMKRWTICGCWCSSPTVEEGREAGREEGRRREGCTLTLSQLEHRCGPLNAAMSSRIEGLSLPQLEELALALRAFLSGEGLQAWLERLGP